MAFGLIWSAYQREQQQFLQLLGKAKEDTAKKLSQALVELAARGKNRGLDNYELYRNLEKLLSLLCLDASHHRVADLVRDRSVDIIKKLRRARFKEKLPIKNTAYAVDQMQLLLLWNPECAEVFEATKVDVGAAELRHRLIASLHQVLQDKVETAAELGLRVPHWIRHEARASSAFAMRALLMRDAQEAFRMSVEGVFNDAKEMHETQRELADALSDYNALLSSFRDIEHAKAASKWSEVKELRNKLRVISVPFRFDALLQMVRQPKISKAKALVRSSTVVMAPLDLYGRLRLGKHANTVCEFAGDLEYTLGLLTGRFGHSQVLERRKREIAALFDAVCATDAERDEIESYINMLHGAVYRRWKKDGWIKQISSNWELNPFSDRLFRGWRKATSKRRKLFLQHHATFQFKSPRQLIEEGVLGIVQTMETHEDNVFVRHTRLNRELEQIYDHVQENTRHGKFDAVIADLERLLGRVSEKGKGEICPPEMSSQIHSYLAFIYAYRGEHLEEAVRLAKRAMSIHATWLTRLAIGWSYHQLGKVPEAIKALEAAKAAAMHAGSGLLPLVYRVLGDAYRDAGRDQDAEQAWQAGWELADDPEWKEQPGLTPFEVAERAGLRKALSENLADS